MKEYLLSEGVEKLKSIKKRSFLAQQRSLEVIKKNNYEKQKGFAVQALQVMLEYFIDEEYAQKNQLQSDGHVGPRLYRTFDMLDDVFNFDYEAERSLENNFETNERLYLGSGVGVQSGYSTILLALNHINLKPGSSVVDLGSGYGRVGLVYSLLRPDLNFLGFEYHPYRVGIANKASQNLNLDKNLKFITQDLSLSLFKIPDSDVYYLYDPFTDESYDYILNQIVEISKRRKVIVITKGNARNWLTKVSVGNSWPEPHLIDNGNLCIFCSQ
ncbi:MAG: class I SAM-dependent methyltransferase [Bacteriovoracaceae bacterium]